jgi:hypothetical protein
VEVKVQHTGELARWEPVVLPVTFADGDALASCGGSVAGALDTQGSDALEDAWIGWTKATCNTAGTTGAWTNMTFSDETVAVNDMARNKGDIAYTAVGYDPSAGFLRTDDLPNGPRPTVAVPVAIGASVLAVGNAWIDPANNRVRPFDQLSVSLDEAAGLVSGGPLGVDPYVFDLKTRNLELTLPDVFSSGDVVRVGGPSQGGVTPWITSRYFDTNRPDIWKVPPDGSPQAGRDRGTTPSFALADPTFTGALTLMTGRGGMAKELGKFISTTPPGAAWFLTDLTTAEAYDLRPVALGSADGSTFVAPDRDSLSAAADAMTPNDTGMRIPDATASVGYPLTYVVYAQVPAQPLTDSTGACRTDSQQLLANWLTYVVRDGQQNMPAGLEPLTPALQAEAETALQEVGQTPGDPCPVPSIPPPGGGTAATPNPTSTGSGSTATAPSTGTGSATSNKGSTTQVDAVEQANAELSVSDSDTPGFFGGTLPSVLAAVLALVLIGGMTAMTARYTSRRTLGAPSDNPYADLPAPPSGAGP